MGVSISNLTPAAKGGDWFLLDESGDFSLDATIMAEIWLVGGGSDGGDGYTDDSGIFHGGAGGRGGNVYKFGRIKLIKDMAYTVTIADANAPSGTLFKFGQITFNSGQAGCGHTLGGNGGIINPYGGAVNPAKGRDGFSTPYGLVGSSGSGGVCAAYLNNSAKSTENAKGGKGAGNSRPYFSSISDFERCKGLNPSINALNYGCGGGGNTYCYGLNDIGVKSGGKGGCVIVKYYVLENESENAPNCSIRYWNNYGNLNKANISTLKENIDTLTNELSSTKAQNEDLKNRIKELESQLAENENNEN